MHKVLADLLPFVLHAMEEGEVSSSCCMSDGMFDGQSLGPNDYLAICSFVNSAMCLWTFPKDSMLCLIAHAPDGYAHVQTLGHVRLLHCGLCRISQTGHTGKNGEKPVPGREPGWGWDCVGGLLTYSACMRGETSSPAGWAALSLQTCLLLAYMG